MQTIVTILSVILAMMIMAPASFAGDCALSVQRTACPGKEAETLRPYEGKNPTTEKYSTADVAGCEKKADRASKIIRKGTLAQKTVTGKFDGKYLSKSFTDNADCQ